MSVPSGVDAPAITAILPCDGQFGTVADVLRHYRQQTVRGSLEIIIAAPAPDAPDIPPEALEPFHSWQLVTHGRTVGAARAEGVRRARAPVVVIGETHSYPDPGAMEALIAAHRGPSAGVMMGMGNANPGPLSWANLAMDYGTWIGGEPRRVRWLPTHNSSFDRHALLDFGDRLPGLLDLSGDSLAAALAARGRTLSHEPRARTLHLNISAYRSCARQRLSGGRIYAGRRSRNWSGVRRAAYVVGAPAIPFVRLPRVLADLRRGGVRGVAVARLLPALGFALALSALGEAGGYAAGPGDGRPGLIRDVEIHRDRHTRRGDLPVPLERHS